MRTRCLIPLAIGLLFVQFAGTAFAAPDPSKLTPEDIAGVLGLQWWLLNVPADAGDNARLKIYWASSNTGEGPDVFTSFWVKPGELIKVFYMAGDATHEPTIRIARPSAACRGSMRLPDGFVSGAETSIGNGSVVKSGDILIKEDRKIPGVDTEGGAPGNSLKPNEIGLKIEITKDPAVAAK
jgi:hypothetical protein